MKKILIISYFFPPCNLVGAQRPYSWFKHFHKCGLYPIVVTRHWKKEVNTITDASLPDNSMLKIEKHDWGEIHYLPYKGSFRDRFMDRHGNSKRIVRKMLTLWELFSQHLWFYFNPYKDFFNYSLVLLNEQKTPVCAAIVCANPFPLFAVGYKLNKKLGLPWIADYRDDWTSNAFKETKKLIEKILVNVERYNEKKWVRSSLFFTSVSQSYVHKIASLTNKQGYLLLNGFEEIQYTEPPPVNNTYILLYAGSVYPGQDFSFLVEALHCYHSSNPEVSFNLTFAGALVGGSIPKNVQQIIDAVNSDFITIVVLPRQSEADFNQLKQRSHILFTAPYGEHKGIIPAKLFHYLSWGKPFILAGTDNDIIEELVSPYGLGYVCKNSEMVLDALFVITETYKKNSLMPSAADYKYINSFRRENQARLLAELIHNKIPSCAE